MVPAEAVEGLACTIGCGTVVVGMDVGRGESCVTVGVKQAVRITLRTINRRNRLSGGRHGEPGLRACFRFSLVRAMSGPTKPRVQLPCFISLPLLIQLRCCECRRCLFLTFDNTQLCFTTGFYPRISCKVSTLLIGSLSPGIVVLSFVSNAQTKVCTGN